MPWCLWRLKYCSTKFQVWGISNWALESFQEFNMSSKNSSTENYKWTLSTSRNKFSVWELKNSQHLRALALHNRIKTNLLFAFVMPWQSAVCCVFSRVVPIVCAPAISYVWELPLFVFFMKKLPPHFLGCLLRTDAAVLWLLCVVHPRRKAFFFLSHIKAHKSFAPNKKSTNTRPQKNLILLPSFMFTCIATLP